MAAPNFDQECPAPRLQRVIDILQTSDEDGLAELDGLLSDYGGDARLHFLRGSVLAGMQRYAEAHEAMGKAVKMAPAFAIARFQLGFLQMTSGDGAAATATWGPLADLPPTNGLRVLAEGLTHLCRDDFAVGFELLERGMTLNTENPIVNRDMQLLMRETKARLAANADESEPLSATQMLLQQQRTKPTRH